MLQEGIRYRLSQACTSSLIGAAIRARVGLAEGTSGHISILWWRVSFCSSHKEQLQVHMITTVHRGEQVMVLRHATGISAVLTAHCNIAGALFLLWLCSRFGGVVTALRPLHYTLSGSQHGLKGQYIRGTLSTACNGKRVYCFQLQ